MARIYDALLRSLYRAGFRTTWFYFGDAATCRELGRARSRELFLLEREHHDHVSRETTPERRWAMYNEFNEAIKQFKRQHLPQRDHYGFVPTYIDEHTDLFVGRRVLDFGCGFGASTRHLASFARESVGVDCSQTCIEAARKTYTDDERVSFELVPSIRLPFSDSTFDAAYSNDVIEHLHIDDAFLHLQEILRLLRPGGHYLVYTPDRASGPHDMTKAFWPQKRGFPAVGSHLHEFTAAELSQLLRAAGFAEASQPEPRHNLLFLARKSAENRVR